MYNGAATNAPGGLDQARFYADQNALKSLARGDDKSPERLRTAAQEFESLFINMMFKTMRQANSVFAEGNPFESQESTFFREMLDNQLSVEMAKGGGIGLADILVRQLAPPDQNKSDEGATTTDHTAVINETIKDVMAPSAETVLNAADLAVADLYGDSDIASTGHVSGANTFKDADPTADEQAQMLYGDQESITPMTMERLRTQATSGNTGASENYIDSNNSRLVTPAYKPDITQQEKTYFDSPEQFVSAVWPDAQRASEKLGVDPKVLVAQAALETGWGKHIMQDKVGGSSHNLFGIKAPAAREAKVAHMTTEYVNGEPQRQRENFRIYNSFSESFDDYVNLLMGAKRYETARAQAGDPKAFMEALQGAGYATDPQYANKIYRIYQGLNEKLASLQQPTTMALAMTSGVPGQNTVLDTHSNSGALTSNNFLLKR